ncbi:hypothetical protein [Conservatibacter flavescens]|uniref:HTH cro/C1-type domain-containing protein n=1 Tax=Conservatibacter flavescens TaxID=28161 RepID=A0A2M8S3I5_9PAST|nr:hypothetical protein [Conservatibacter flavescens]PJG85719.1 hypothetical protein CVP05_05020 [Conservatibacter flavescens]
MNERIKFAENLKRILIAKGYKPTASVIERELNLRYYGKPIGQAAVAKWLRGDGFPTTERLKTLCEWLEIEPNELVSEALAYKVAKLSQAKPEVKKEIWELAQSYDEEELIKIFLNLPKEQKKTVREVIMAMHKAYRTLSK